MESRKVQNGLLSPVLRSLTTVVQMISVQVRLFFYLANIDGDDVLDIITSVII